VHRAELAKRKVNRNNGHSGPALNSIVGPNGQVDVGLAKDVRAHRRENGEEGRGRQQRRNCRPWRRARSRLRRRQAGIQPPPRGDHYGRAASNATTKDVENVKTAGQTWAIPRAAPLQNEQKSLAARLARLRLPLQHQSLRLQHQLCLLLLLFCPSTVWNCSDWLLGKSWRRNVFLTSTRTSFANG